MHFSGCSASCAQPQIADIAFRGETAHVGESIVEAVDVGLGGGLGPDAAFADWVAGAVPVGDVPDAIAAVLHRYLAERRAGEPFRSFVRRLGAEDLAPQLSTAGVSGRPVPDRDAGARSTGTDERPTTRGPT